MNLHGDYRTEVFPKEHLTAVDFQDGKGGYTSFKVKIKDVLEKELMDRKTNKKQPKVILTFEKGSKYLILNKTMADALFEITGQPIPKKWAGHTIELFVEKGVHTPQGRVDVPRIRKPTQTASA